MNVYDTIQNIPRKKLYVVLLVFVTIVLASYYLGVFMAKMQLPTDTLPNENIVVEDTAEAIFIELSDDANAESNVFPVPPPNAPPPPDYIPQ